jgi:hypothetical protein
MGAGETLIEEIERQLRDAVPQISSVYVRPEKTPDAVIRAGWSY